MRGSAAPPFAYGSFRGSAALGGTPGQARYGHIVAALPCRGGRMAGIIWQTPAVLASWCLFRGKKHEALRDIAGDRGIDHRLSAALAGTARNGHLDACRPASPRCVPRQSPT